jgi:glucosamine--fructose-6-phosphate aminotransferase (isomerizing)
MPLPHSILAQEIAEAPAAVARQAEELRAPLRALAERLRRTPPHVVVTCARGSSAHAATFSKHLIERYLGIPVAAAAPNIATVYGRELQLKDQLFIAVSQSGRSDDLLEQSKSARAAGALTVALVNDTSSPLAQTCEFLLPMAAGAEQAVAATKSFVASLAAFLHLVADWSGRSELADGLERLPERLAQALHLDWAAALDGLGKADALIVVGRGPTLAIAREAALKLKETCGVQAEAYSSAEVLHGPVTLVAPGYPVLLLAPTDEAAAGMAALATDLAAKQAALYAAGLGKHRGIDLPVLPPEQAEADAICLVQTFYGMMPALAAIRGRNADSPRHLQKVTRTR